MYVNIQKHKQLLYLSNIFRFAKKNDLAMLEYCTLPRTGALEVILDILGPVNKLNNGFANSLQDDSKISKICDVTIAYPEGKPLDLFQIGFGSRPPCVTHVHYRVFDVKDVNFFFQIIFFCTFSVYLCNFSVKSATKSGFCF